jgi:eukaryotic-like serine/threonine-protein kinase
LTDDAPRPEARVLNRRYRLVYQLGAGGMGSVWLADDQLLERSVALKELLPWTGRAGLPARRARAVQEARAMARVRHPAIVPIHDVFFIDEDPWIVMDYISGRSLSDMIQQGTLDERSIARIGLHVLRGLAAVHRAGVVHRDVKPANILVADDGSIFLVDFGIARIAGDTSLTGHSILGTPDFLAPERLREGHEVGPPADLWALGVTFYFALEGYSPFWRESESGWQAILLAILNEPPRRPAHGGPLADLTLRMLSKDPERRANADQILAVLESIVRTPPAPPLSMPSRPPEPVEFAESAARPQLTRALTDPGPEPPRSRSWRGQATRQSPPQEAPAGEQPAHVRPLASPQSAGEAPRRSAALRQPAALAPASAYRPNRGAVRNGAVGNGRHDRFAEARDMIRNVGTDTGVAMLLAMSEADAARILADCPPKLCGDLLQGISAVRPATAATILRTLRSRAAGRAFAYLRPQTASSLVAEMTPHEALRILDNADERTVAAVLMELPVPVSARLVKSMYSQQRAAQVLTHVRPSTAAELLRPDAEFAAGVLRHLSEPVRKQVSRYLTAEGSAS